MNDLDGKLIDIVHTLAFEGSEPQYKQTSGGKIWWQTIAENEAYVIQQNMVTQHYRLLTVDGKRIASSINLEDLTAIFTEK